MTTHWYRSTGESSELAPVRCDGAVRRGSISSAQSLVDPSAMPTPGSAGAPRGGETPEAQAAQCLGISRLPELGLGKTHLERTF